MLTSEIVRDHLDYDPNTGALVWKKTRSNFVKAGAPVGHLSQGYLRFQFCGRNYYVHRVIWLIVHGEWPPEQIDHIDCDPLNNRIDNLRLASNPENQRNKKLYANNTCGLKGAYYNRRRNLWQAGIKFNNKFISLGMHATAESAHAAYAVAAERLYGEFARLS